MQKILSIGENEFLKGIAIGRYSSARGLFHIAEGIDPYQSIGYLMSGFDKTDLTGAIVTDTIKYFALDGANGKCYACGDGRMYSIALSDDAVTYLSKAVSGGVDGLYVYKDTLIYPNGTTVGSYGALSGTPAFDDDGVSGAAGITSDADHPMIEGPDARCYVGDVSELNSFSLIDGPPSSDWSAGDLVLGSDYTITCLENDGYYLVIGAANKQGTYRSKGDKVFFWDTFSAKPNKEWPIPDSNMTAMKKVGDWIYAFCIDGIYRFNYDNAPQLIIPKGEGATGGTLRYARTRPSRHGVDEWKGQLLWGDQNIWAYGNIPGNTPIFTNPFKLGTSGTPNINALKVKRYDSIYVSYTGDKLYAVKSGSSGATATTVPIDLKRPWRIQGIKIVTKVLASGDSLTANIQNEAGTDIITGTFAFTGDGAKTSKMIKEDLGTAQPVTDQVIIDLDFTGAVRIKRIDLFGEPVDETYAQIQ